MSFTDDFEDDALADIYDAVGEDVLVYPVPAPLVSGYVGTPVTVRGMFTRRDAVMSDGANEVDTVMPVFECSVTDGAAASLIVDVSAIVFDGTTYKVVRTIRRDARVLECYLREA